MPDQNNPGPSDATLLRRLRWLSVLAPLAFLALVEVVRLWLGLSVSASPQTYLGLLIVVGAATAGFAWAVFGVIDRLQARLPQRNLALSALDTAGLAIVRGLDLQVVLQGVVDQARELSGARYGALSYPVQGQEHPVFLTSGISAEERGALGPTPRGHGLLGVVMSDGEHLRMVDLTRDPRSVGFPPNHPPMRSLLAVPIPGPNGLLGNLYVSEKGDGAGFTIEDERTLERFATHAALAIGNARLHQQGQALATTEERERIARELHDNMAQVLGYVSTKAQAVEALISRGEAERATEQTRQLADAARAAYADVREGILGLRSTLNRELGFVGTLREYLAAWQGQSGVVGTLIADGNGYHDLPLSPTSEVQLLRIVQEALANVRKHAGAQEVRVRIRVEVDQVIITIADDGQGFAPDDASRSLRPRFGLATMRERAQAIGATFELDHGPGRGTRITLLVPTDLSLSIGSEDVLSTAIPGRS